MELPSRVQPGTVASSSLIWVSVSGLMLTAYHSHLTSFSASGGEFQPVSILKEHELRFAVHPLRQPGASPRSHGVPRRDVDGRVHVGVTGKATGHAAVQGLALAAARCYVPARRATLARKGGMNPLHSSWGLVLQAAHHQPPPGSQDASVQPSLSPDVTTRPL